MTATEPHPMVNLPPGPRWPAPVQAIAFSVFRPETVLAQAHRYGPSFSAKLPLFGQATVITEPPLIKQLFLSPPTEMETIDPSLDLMFGKGSTFGLRGDQHRRRRKLLTPPFHGKRMRAYEAMIEEETLKEIATWPDDEEFSVLPSSMRITLNVILRAVFGADGKELQELRELVPAWVEFGSRLFGLRFLHHDLGPWSPWGRHLAKRRQFDRIVDSLIDKARADRDFENRDDVLSLMLQARYEDGAAMSRQEIGDELATLLAAGHETTATTLAWALERLQRNPGVLAELVEAIDEGDDKFLQATVYEVQRVRPVIDGVVRRVAAPTVTLGQWVLPHGHHVFVSATAVHNDPALYPNPDKFDPLRFLGKSPDNFAWVPFGGGNRRCIGAAFANMEMLVVLRTILRHRALQPTSAPNERQKYRGVAFAPARGGRVLLHRRNPATQVKPTTNAGG
ncbi:cytochrome P450 [Nocardia sp. NPDC057663]|uniref:cytochrome P450 n=1 Tax=Nocardia sp. NPDC057663 TaxID=3346201 RepID=UPI00366C2F13